MTSTTPFPGLRALRRHAASAVLGLAALPGLVRADVPILDLVFRSASVVVQPGEVVPVWVTLTAHDAPLSFDTTSGVPPFGLDPAMLPATGTDPASGRSHLPFGSYAGILLSVNRTCNDEVSLGCDPGVYEFGVPTGPGSWFDLAQPFTLEAGTSRDFLLFELLPVGGVAAPGSYRLFNVGLGLYTTGFATDGVTSIEGLVFDTMTCLGAGPECAMTVTVVPEPAAPWLMLVGLVPLWMRVRFGATRRRERCRA